MSNIFLISIATLFYSLATSWQVFNVYKKQQKNTALIIFAIIALIAHSNLLYHWIDVGNSQNLTVLNLFSLSAWLVALWVVIVTLTKPVANLLLFIFPIAIASIVLAVSFPTWSLVNTIDNPKQLVHILLSTLTFSLLCVAALQAVVLAVQEWVLRHKQATQLIQILPPLETMETLLFQMIGLGFIFLTLLLLSSLVSFPDLFGAPILSKTLLSVFSWVIFFILLLGRYYFGWRGKIAVRWTLIGVLAITLVYFGTIILM